MQISITLTLSCLTPIQHGPQLAREVVWFAVDLLAPAETLSVPTVLSRCWTVTVAKLFYFDTHSGLCNGSS